MPIYFNTDLEIIKVLLSAVLKLFIKEFLISHSSREGAKCSWNLKHDYFKMTLFSNLKKLYMHFSE